MSEAAMRPVSLLIGALGGEGGGVLADWITEAATAEGYPVQRTSVPGVAQRTGATTYYIEVFPQAWAELGGREPVFALFPNPGMVDLVVATEILEAGRAMERGFVTPDRTTLIASTHRIFAIGEKSAPADGRYDERRIVAAANELARRPLLFDIGNFALRRRLPLNAVLLGLIAGTGVLPFGDAAFRDAVRRVGKAAAQNIAGFDAGLDAMREPPAPPTPAAKRTAAGAGLPATVRAEWPEALHAVAAEALPRLSRYQNAAYAERWLARVANLVTVEREAGVAEGTVSREAARHLAVWMSFEDIVRVAQAKAGAARYERVRAEIGAKPGQVVRLTEFLKPGIAEWADLMPPALGRKVLRWAERRGRSFNVGLHVRSDTVTGFLMLSLLARLRGWRPHTLRFAEENAAIDAWLDALRTAIRRDVPLAREIAELPRLRKGYGETRARGLAKYERLMQEVALPALRAGETGDAAARLKALRRRAMMDADDTPPTPTPTLTLPTRGRGHDVRGASHSLQTGTPKSPPLVGRVRVGGHSRDGQREE